MLRENQQKKVQLLLNQSLDLITGSPPHVLTKLKLIPPYGQNRVLQNLILVPNPARMQDSRSIRTPSASDAADQLPPSTLRLESERGEGGGGERDPLPSAPPLQAQLSPSHTKPLSNFPNIFQSSAPNARPNLIPHTTLPSFFQPSSSAPAFPPRSQFRPFTNAPPSIFTTAPNSHSTHTNQLYQQHTPRSQYTNTSHSRGAYPPPTYPQNNSPYSTGQGTSPWRGGGVAAGLGGLIQHTQQPHNFLYQSGHTPSPTHFGRTCPQQWLSDKPFSLPGSPRKGPSQEERARSTQPPVATSEPSHSQYNLISRPRPSPPRSVPPLIRQRKRRHNGHLPRHLPHPPKLTT